MELSFPEKCNVVFYLVAKNWPEIKLNLSDSPQYNKYKNVRIFHLSRPKNVCPVGLSGRDCFAVLTYRR